jgi:tetratricopeptide repeat protein 30
LLGFCFFHLQDYPSAVTAYEALLQLCPGEEEYKMVYAQALYNAGLYPEAMRASVRVEGLQYMPRKLMLQVRDGFHALGGCWVEEGLLFREMCK